MENKKPISLEHAYVMAWAEFNEFDMKAIQNSIELAQDEKEKILKEYRNNAVSIFQDNIFVDQNVIFEIDYIKGLMETWNEMLSFGKDYPFVDRVPKEFIEKPFNFVFKTLCAAKRAKLIIDYCNAELMPKEGTQPKGEEQSIDDILREIFPGILDVELRQIKENLRGGKQYFRLTYIGTKNTLWIKLGMLHNAGIERHNIERVFSDCVRWAKYSNSTPEEIPKEHIVRNLPGKGKK